MKKTQKVISAYALIEALDLSIDELDRLISELDCLLQSKEQAQEEEQEEYSSSPDEGDYDIIARENCANL